MIVWRCWKCRQPVRTQAGTYEYPGEIVKPLLTPSGYSEHPQGAICRECNAYNRIVPAGMMAQVCEESGMEFK